jgi:hypothetical protein
MNDESSISRWLWSGVDDVHDPGSLPAGHPSHSLLTHDASDMMDGSISTLETFYFGIYYPWS